MNKKVGIAGGIISVLSGMIYIHFNNEEIFNESINVSGSGVYVFLLASIALIIGVIKYKTVSISAQKNRDNKNSVTGLGMKGTMEKDKTKHLKILILDEDKETKILYNHFVIQNCEIILTTSFQKALKLVNESCDIAFINIEMKQFIEKDKFTGLKLIRKISRSTKIPIILIVPNLEKVKQEIWWRMHPSAIQYIEKPYVEEDIIKIARKIAM